jgi:hypothetical protein
MCHVNSGQEACANQYGSRDSRSAEEVHFRLLFAFVSFTPGMPAKDVPRG